MGNYERHRVEGGLHLLVAMVLEVVTEFNSQPKVVTAALLESAVKRQDTGQGLQLLRTRPCSPQGSGGCRSPQSPTANHGSQPSLFQKRLLRGKAQDVQDG